VRRVLVGGISGSGKTTLARELARRTGLPYHEMDAYYHGPGWVPIPSFVTDIAAIAEQPEWVFDSHGYAQVRDLVWSRADTVVWLDYSRSVVVRRVVRRSARRALTGEPTFNGNTETFRAWLDPEHPVQWAVRMYQRRREVMWQGFTEPRFDHVRRVRITRPEAARIWLDHVAPPVGVPARP
jgi:adenylate kinase family enzyme